MRRNFLTALIVILISACNSTPTALPISATSTATAATIEVPTTLPEPSATPVSLELIQLQMVDVQNGWLVADLNNSNRHVLHTTDGGVSWQDVTPPSVAYVDEGIFFYDANNAWIPTSTLDSNIPTTYHTTDGGESWQTYQNLPFEKPTLHFSTPLIGWAQSDYNSDPTTYSFKLWQTSDGGAKWTQLKFAPSLGLPDLPDGRFLLNDDQQLGFQNESTFWFGGRQSTNPDDVYLQVSKDTGINWAKKLLSIPEIDKGQGDPLVSYGLPVFITDLDAYLVIGYTFSSAQDYSVLMFTHDGGETWRATPAVLNGTAWSLHLQFVTPADGFAFCGYILCVTHNGSRTWQDAQSNIIVSAINGYSGISDIDFVTVDTGWGIYHDGPLTKLVKTMDGGQTWKTLFP